ncbi:SH3 domain-containing protein 21 [Lepisosteus oculatus]|uniref:SH3 domain-containing protein 21 n=1 Tax=Lepisosteus oculatus TaxID=7918 RepID=UPI0035F528F3
MEVLVLMDFVGNLDDELVIKAGDIIKNVKQSMEEGWLEGELNGKQGVFPANFAKEIPVYLTGDSQRIPRSIRTSKTVKKKPTKYEAVFAYTPMNLDELELTVGDVIDFIKEIEDGWWLGAKNGKAGAFPSNFVKEVSPKDAKLNETNSGAKIRPKLSECNFNKEPKQEKSSLRVKHKTNNVKEFCQVMFDYTANAEDELTLKKGEIVTIISKTTEDEGWWEGEINGKHGFFPDNFVMAIPTQPLESGDANHPPVRKGSRKASVKQEALLMEKKIFEQAHPIPCAKGEANEEKHETKDLRSDPPSKVQLPVIKKVPPPIKTKPPKNLPIRQNGDLPPLSPKHAEDTTDKVKEKEPDQFDGVDVTTDKLSHPTANRAKLPGRRPPTNLHWGATAQKPVPSTSETNDEVSQLQSKLPGVHKVIENPTAGKPDPLAKISPLQKPVPSKPREEPGASVEKLRAEVKELSLALEILKALHLKDTEDLRQELKDEKAKRTALQDEVQLLKKAFNNH